VLAYYPDRSSLVLEVKVTRLAYEWYALAASTRRWALISPDGVVPSRMVGVSASVNLSLHHKVQKFSSGIGSPGWSQKKGCETVVVYGGDQYK